MNTRSIRLTALVVALGLAIINNPAAAQGDFVTPGSNTNIIGITPDPANIPDFGLKQQQEPSCIVRPGNASYIFCAYNDLRASDLPPIQGDSWIGVSMSNDAGQTWLSRLAPGFLGHPNSLGMGFAADPSVVAIPGNSPGLAVLNYIAGFRDSNDGVLAIQRWVEFPQEDQDFWKDENQFYIVADGSNGRFIDKPAFYYLLDPVSQQGTITEQIFVAGETDPITVTTPTGTLIVAYAVFTGQSGGAKVLVQRSFDNGKTWTQAVKISEEQNEVTGVSITAKGQKYVVVYRRRGDNNEPDAIMSAFCSNDGNQKCTKGKVMFEHCPFDQPASGSTHRTFSFPWAASDGKRFWVFAADRRFANDLSCTPVPGLPGLFSGKPRIVGMSSLDGKTWVGSDGNEGEPFVVADRADDHGFQVMPVALGTKGRVDIAWYDTFREELFVLPAGNNDLLINDYISGTGLAHVFRKADVYMTRLTAVCGNNANAGCTPVIQTPVRVSKFPSAIDLTINLLQEFEAHLPNLRLYASGTLAFNGDYISLATPTSRELANGKFISNSLPEGVAGEELPGYTDRQDLFVAWGDNRDVHADFPGPNSTTQLPYTPPLNSDANPGGPVTRLEDSEAAPVLERPGELVAIDEPDDDPTLPGDLSVCVPGSFDFSHSRDSNVYGSLVRDESSLVAPTPTKPLGTIQRMFPLVLTNVDIDDPQDFCLHVANQPLDHPGNGLASFFQLPSIAPFSAGDEVALLDVNVPAGSSASRGLFVTTNNGASVITVNAYEGACPASDAGPFGALVNSVQLSDGALFDPVFCETNACDPVSVNETHNITLEAPGLQAPVLQAPSFQAPGFQAPVLQAPVLQAPGFQAPSFQAPGFQAPVLQAPSFQAPSFQAPSFQAPVLQAPSLQAPSLQAGTLIGDAELDQIVYQDITFVVSADGNVTTTYSADIGLSGLDSDQTAVQLIAWTPNIYTDTEDCFAVPQANNQIIAYTQLDAPSLQAVSLPATFSPNAQDPYAGALSFFGSSGKDIALTVRIWAAGPAKQTLEDLHTVFQNCLADPLCDNDDPNLGVRQLISFGASAHSCSTDDAENNTTFPNQPDCLDQGHEKIFQDKQPPTLLLPDDFSQEATGPDGAVVNYVATATDGNDPNPSIDCTPASGSTFGLGANTVTCIAEDESGNSADGSFTITIVDTVLPVLTIVPPDTPIEATSADGAVAVFTATAIDLGLPLGVTCDANSGATFPLGTTTVTCTTDPDGGGNIASDSFDVTVEDTTPPVIALIGDAILIVEAGTGYVELGAVVSDLADLAPTLSIDSSAVNTAVVGTYIVFYDAVDAAGNPALQIVRTVNVEDTVLPVLNNVPPDQTIEATGPAGAVANFTPPTATDLGLPLGVTCVPSSGVTFPLGTTTVTCTTDPDGGNNTASASFNITVEDTTAPIVDAHDDITAVLDDATGKIVDFVVTATDIVDPNPVVTCNPASGSLFPPGTTTVTCSATDSSGNTSADSSFDVTVELGTGTGLSSSKNSVKSGSVAPFTWAWTNSSGDPVDVGIGNQDIEARAGNCPSESEDILDEDPGSSGFQLKADLSWQYNWQTVDGSGNNLDPGPYCVSVILLTTGQIQSADIRVRP